MTSHPIHERSLRGGDVTGRSGGMEPRQLRCVDCYCPGVDMLGGAVGAPVGTSVTDVSSSSTSMSDQ